MFITLMNALTNRNVRYLYTQCNFALLPTLNCNLCSRQVTFLSANDKKTSKNYRIRKRCRDDT